jgi:hypothetical protein
MNKIKIAIVTGFSENLLPLAKQCFLSACRSARKGQIDFDITACYYEYNWLGSSKINLKWGESADFTLFNQPIDLSTELPLKDVHFIRYQASDIQHTKQCLLPDIKIYHDFATKHLDQYDYAMFCHNDVIFNENLPIFDEMISVLSKGSNAFVGEPHLDCRDEISLRIYPHFIFVYTAAFRNYGLSFINDYRIFDPRLRSWDMSRDGGSHLLASCYQYQPNRPEQKPAPWAAVSKMWFTHLRLINDAGVESSNVFVPNLDELKRLLEEAERYVDLRLYGKPNG